MIRLKLHANFLFNQIRAEKNEKQENGKEDKGRRRRRRKRERKGKKEGREKRRQKIHEAKAVVDDSKSCEYKFILFLSYLDFDKVCHMLQDISSSQILIEVHFLLYQI